MKLIKFCKIVFVVVLFLLRYEYARACSGTPSYTYPATGCINAAVTFTNTSSGSATTYIWKWGDASANTVVGSTAVQTHTYATSGTFTIWLVQVFSSPTCRDSVSHTITIHTLPSPAFTFAINNSCSNNPIQFTNSTPGAGNTYAWNFGNGANSTATSPSQMFNAYGVSGTQAYTVTLTATSSFGCSASTNQTVTVQNRPNGALLDNVGITSFANCDGSVSVTLDVGNMSTFTGNVTNYSINWGDASPNYSSPSLGVSTTHSYNSQGYSNIILTLTSSTGCHDTTVYQFYNGSNPSVGLTNPGSTVGCPPPITFSFNNIANNTPGTTYEVSSNDGTPTMFYTQSNLPSPLSHTFSIGSCGYSTPSYNNSFFIKIKAINPCGSSTSLVDPIVISQRPTASFTSSAQIACINQVINFTNTTANANQVVLQGGVYNCVGTTKLNWLITPATGWTVTSGALGSNPPITNNPATWGSNTLGVTFTQTGNYVVKIITAGVTCGNDTATQTICVIDPVTPAFTLNALTGCAPFNCTANNTTPTPTCGNNTYNWVVTYSATNSCDNAAAFTFTGGTTAASQNPSFNFTNAGTYTVTLNVTNPCGTTTTFQTVTVNKPPQVSVNSIADFCGSGTITPTATIDNCGSTISTYAWTFTGGIPASSAIQNPVAIAYTAPSIYNVNLSISNACGSANSSTSFNLFAPPNVSVTPSTNTICPGQAATITAAGASTFAWAPATGLNTTIGASVIATPATSTTYIVTGSSGSCFDTAHVIVNVNPTPTITIIPPNPSICIGQNIALTASGALTYVWSPSTALTATSGATVTANPLITTLYTVVGTAANTCTNTANVNVVINPLPVVNAGPDQQFCNTNNTFNIVPITPANGTWTGLGITAAGVFNPSIPGNGAWDLIYTFTDANGCINADTLIATVSSPSGANAGSGFSICATGGISLLTGATPIGGTWSGAGITGNNFDPSLASIGDNIITYSIGAGSCMATDTIHIDVLANPTLAILPMNPSICEGSSINLTASGATSYVWSPLIGLSATTGAAVVGNPIITTAYTVIGTGANACTSTFNFTLNVNPLPLVDAGLDQQFCNTTNTSTLIPVSALGGIWSGPGISSAGIFDPSLAGNGAWDLIYEVTDINGCINSDTLIATVVSNSIANAGNGFTLCINANPIVLSTGSPVGGTWTGVGVSAGSFDPSLASIGINFLTYSIGSGICLTSDTLQINVAPLPAVSITASQATSCFADSITLTGNGAFTYAWSPTAGLSNNVGTVISASIQATGYYYVTGTSNAGCANMDSVMINVYPFQPVYAGIDQQFCNQNTPVQLTGFTPANGIWSGSGVSASGLFTPTLAGVGNWNLIYSFIDVNGCNNKDTLIATVIVPVQAFAGTDTAACESTTTFNIGGTPTGGTWSGTNITPSGSFTPNITGTNVVTYTIGSGTCITSDTRDIIVNALPIVSIGSDIDFCTSTPVTNLTSNIGGGIWSGTGISNVALGSFNPSLLSAGLSSQLIYQVTNALTGCTNSDSLIASVHALPVVLFDSLPMSCTNTSIQFINNTVGNNTYQWNFSDGGTSQLQQAQHTFATIDTFIVQLIVTNAMGCVDSLQQGIAITTVPTSSFIDNQNAICGLQTVSFTNTSSAQFATYNWNFGNGITSNVQTPGPITFDIYNAIDTNYIVTLSTTNLCGVSNYSDTIHLISFPTAAFSYFPQVACSGSGVNFSNASLGYNNTYKWFIDGNLVSTNYILPTHTFIAGNTDSIYNVTLETTNQCNTVSTTLAITVHPAMVYPFFTIDSTVACLGQLVNFISSVPSYNYIVWNYGDGVNSIGTVPSHNYTSPGNYTVWQIVYGYCGIDSISRPVTILPNPIPLFSTANPLCEGATALFQNLTVGNNILYQWDFGDGQSSGLFSPTHAYALGNFNVQLTVTSATSLCKDSLTLPITVLPKPIANFNVVDNEVCLGAPIQINALQTAGLNYQWELSDGSTLVGTQINYLFQDTGTYSFTLKVNDNNQCFDDTSYSLLFVRPNAIADFNASQQPPCATNVSMLFNNASTLANNYVWNFGIYGNSNYQTPLPISFNSEVNFIATLTANNSYNCPHSISKPIQVNIKPTATFTAPDSVCQNEIIFLQNSSINSSLFTWTANGENLENTSPPSYTASESGNIVIQLFATSMNDATCIDSIKKTIVVNKIPEAQFYVTSLDSIVNGEAISPCGGYYAFTPAYDFTTNLYAWELGDGTTSAAKNPRAFYANNGAYNVELYVQNIYGCENKSDTLVNVYCDGNIILPNALAPSSNDKSIARFIPKGKNIESLKIEIYATWGERVWYTESLDKEGSPTEYWDGTYKDKDLPQGAYLVKLKATFEFKPPVENTFYVTLIR